MYKNQQKQAEANVHNQLYSNIYLLTLKHPPSDKFKKVFKKDMFINNNKVAFQQTVYYLLSILNPEKLRKNITTWPLYDPRSESQFRNEVIKYLNELNSLYTDADIPTVTVSHLISPNGFKFMKLMLKLTHLVMYEELQKNPEISKKMLHRIIPSSKRGVENRNISHLNDKICALNKNIQETISKFETNLIEYRAKAMNIKQSQAQVNAELPVLEHKLYNLQNQQAENKNLDIDPEEISASIQSLQDEIVDITEFDLKLKNLHCLVSSIVKGDLHLDGNTLQSNTESEAFNLLDQLNVFNQLLIKKCSEMKVLTGNELSQSINKFCSLNDEMQKFSVNLTDIHKSLSSVMKSLKQRGSNRNDTLESCKPICNLEKEADSDSTVLATPLEDSN